MYTMRALSQERTSPGFSGKKRIRQRPLLPPPIVVVLRGITRAPSRCWFANIIQPVYYSLTNIVIAVIVVLVSCKTYLNASRLFSLQ